MQTLSREPAASMVAPYSWLLDRVGNAGIKLTAAGYLPPAVVVAAVAEAHLSDCYGKGNREEQGWAELAGVPADEWARTIIV